MQQTNKQNNQLYIHTCVLGLVIKFIYMHICVFVSSQIYSFFKSTFTILNIIVSHALFTCTCSRDIGITSSCHSPAVHEGDTANITCQFNTNIESEKLDFQVDRYKIDSVPSVSGVYVPVSWILLVTLCVLTLKNNYQINVQTHSYSETQARIHACTMQNKINMSVLQITGRI